MSEQSPSETFLTETYSKFSSFLHQFVFSWKALKQAQAATLLPPWKSPQISSILLQGLQADVNEIDAAEYLRKVQESDSHSAIYFLALYAMSEGILSTIPPKKNPWKLPSPLRRPKRFFDNLPFDHYVRISEAVIWEISATRNALMHNNGKKDKKYIKRATREFKSLGEDLKHLPNYYFISELEQRLNLPEGTVLPVNFGYLYASSIFLFDRILLKSGLFADPWEKKPSIDESEVVTTNFRLVPPFK